MKITHSSTIQSLILAAVLSIGLGFVSPVSAQEHSYIVDSNGKGLADLGTLGGSCSYASASTTPGRWWGPPPRPQVLAMPLSPAPMAWA